MRYIEELETTHVGNAIARLCQLGGIEYGDHVPEIAEFVRKQYAKYQVELLPRAFDAWLGGLYSDIYSPKRLNLPFVTKIINQYRMDNWRTLDKKEPLQLTAPPPKTDWRESVDSTALTFKRAYHGHREMLSMRLMAINWRDLMNHNEASDTFNNHEVNEMIDWLEKYETEYTKYITYTLPQNKRDGFSQLLNETASLNRDQIVWTDAAKFALHILNENKN